MESQRWRLQFFSVKHLCPSTLTFKLLNRMESQRWHLQTYTVKHLCPSTFISYNKCMYLDSEPITTPFRPCETCTSFMHQGIQYQYHIISFSISICLICIILYIFISHIASISHIEPNTFYMCHNHVHISYSSHTHVWCFHNHIIIKYS